MVEYGSMLLCVSVPPFCAQQVLAPPSQILVGGEGVVWGISMVRLKLGSKYGKYGKRGKYEKYGKYGNYGKYEKHGNYGTYSAAHLE